MPFSRQYYPRQGSLVDLSAQKILVLRRDPASFIEAKKVVDDGRSGTLHVTIRVNGAILARSETSEAFGIAGAKARIP